VREEITNSQSKSKFESNVSPQTRFKQDENKILELSISKNPGFYQFENSSLKNNVAAQLTVDAFTKPITYNNILVIRFSCIEPGSIFTIYPKNKNIIWHIENQKYEGKNIDGTSQIDDEGFVRIRFLSEGNIGDKSIMVKFANTNKKLTLNTGPYEFFYSLDACRSKTAD
jgi:hypothetical protein